MKDSIELAYERMNHELGIHWNRINLTWLIVTAAFSALGYLLFHVSKITTDNVLDAERTFRLLHLLAVIASAAALIASVVWRSIIVSGNNWVQIWEQKIGIMEQATGRVLYLAMNGEENSKERILEEYRKRFGIRLKEHPSITVAYSHLSLIAILAAATMLVVLVMIPAEFGIVARSDWRHFAVLGGAVFWSILIEWPIAIDLRKNNRVLTEESVKNLEQTILKMKNDEKTESSKVGWSRRLLNRRSSQRRRRT